MDRMTAEQKRLNDVSNEAMRRTHTTIDSYADALARGRPMQELTAEETQAIFRGAAWGLAYWCSLMRFERKPGAQADIAPEVELGQMLAAEFLAGFQYHKQQQALTTGEGEKAS
jgi:hypothetical protein